MSGKIECRGISHRPPQVVVNPDEFLIADMNRSLRIHQTSLNFDDQTRLFGNSAGKILVLADGVGDDSVAERASTVAVDAVSHHVLNGMAWLNRSNNAATAAFRSHLEAALDECQAELNLRDEVINPAVGMATNMIIAFVAWPKLFVIQVGNGRSYLLRNQVFQQLTPMPERPAESRSDHSVIGGSSPEIRAETSITTLCPGDRLLLASDGLHNFVSELTIAEAMRTYDSANDTLEQLVRIAVENQANDAVSAVLTHFSSGTPAAAKSEPAGRPLTSVVADKRAKDRPRPVIPFEEGVKASWAAAAPEPRR